MVDRARQWDTLILTRGGDSGDAHYEADLVDLAVWRVMEPPVLVTDEEREFTNVVDMAAWFERANALMGGGAVE